MIDNIWRDRIAMADVLVAHPGFNRAAFAAIAMAERARRASHAALARPAQQTHRETPFMSLVEIDPATARSKFLKQAFTLRHTLADHPLFTLPRLVHLAKSMPRDRIEYNSGKVPVGVKPEDVPKIDRSADEVIRSIETADAWMVIKNVEEDPDYRALLKTFVEDANRAAGRGAGDYDDLQGFIFVSSAQATTPFHIDAEENILIQIRGDKFVRTFDNGDRCLISEEDMEISPSKHRNQRYEPWFEERATMHRLKPGDALHMPYMIPHWVSTAGPIPFPWP